MAGLPPLLRRLTRDQRWLCAPTTKAVAVLMAALLAGQSVQPAKIALRTLSPQQQRETESETPSPEEISKEAVPSAWANAQTARARRAAADRQNRCQHVPARTLQSVGSRRIFHAPIPSDQAGRNGLGGPLRC